MFSNASVLQGVVTHSSGNHGGALALAAKLRGIPAHVVVPHDTPLCKVGAIEGYGGAPHCRQSRPDSPGQLRVLRHPQPAVDMVDTVGGEPSCASAASV